VQGKQPRPSLALAHATEIQEEKHPPVLGIALLVSSELSYSSAYASAFE
jgi:hypothetical protein